MNKPLQVTGIGHALVDIIAPCEEALLGEFSLDKGTMRLTSPEEAAALYERMGPAVETSGGSAANTCAGIASLGGRAGFMGKVGHDQFARVFEHDLRSIGVVFSDGEAKSETPTGRCLILVTPDGERTMNTNLGAASEFGDANLDRALIEQSQVLLSRRLFVRSGRGARRLPHRRGYRPPRWHQGRFHLVRCLLRRPPSRRVPHLHPRPRRYRVRQRAGTALALPGSTFEEACATLGTECEIAAITRSEKGAAIVSSGRVISVPRCPSKSSSMPRAPATSTRRASCSGWRRAATSKPAGGSAALRRPRLSSMSARGQGGRLWTRRGRMGCSKMP